MELSLSCPPDTWHWPSHHSFIPVPVLASSDLLDPLASLFIIRSSPLCLNACPTLSTPPLLISIPTWENSCVHPLQIQRTLQMPQSVIPALRRSWQKDCRELETSLIYEFQASQGYKARLCLKTKQNTNTNTHIHTNYTCTNDNRFRLVKSFCLRSIQLM